MAAIISAVAFLPSYTSAATSVIAEGEGQSCSESGPVTEQTEQQAIKEAIGNAGLNAGHHVAQQAGLLDSLAGKELSRIYSQAQSKGFLEISKDKYSGSGGKSCLKVQVQVELVPDNKKDKVVKMLVGDRGPLEVEITPEQSVFRRDDNVFFSVKGNKEFYASIVYSDAVGSMISIIPNKYHPDTRFEANRVYRFPAPGDFSIKVLPPFGIEQVTVYAATVPLDQLGEIVPTGGVSTFDNMSNLKSSLKNNLVIEYVEKTATLETRESN